MSGYIGSDGSALSGGLNPSSVAQALAVDSAGRLYVVQTVGGLPLTSSNPEPNISNLQLAALGGQAFSVVTGIVSTGAGNAYGGLQAIVNNIAKNVLVYGLYAMLQNISADMRVYQNNASTADANLTANLLASILNQQVGGGGASSALSALWGSPAATTQAGGFVGSQRYQSAAIANTVQNLLPSWVWFPKGAVGSLAAYVKIPTSGNSYSLGMDWIEW